MPLTAAQAFLIQARSDFEVYQQLQMQNSIPDCHWLHYLQMSCEKLAKAYRANAGEDFQTVSKSHVGFSKFAGPMYRQYSARYLGKAIRDNAPQIRNIISLAREIELLQPSIDRDLRPDNCEYPWPDSSGNIVSPVQYKFDLVRQLREPSGKSFLKFVAVSLNDLADSISS
jgi:hypothetical protein